MQAEERQRIANDTEYQLNVLAACAKIGDRAFLGALITDEDVAWLHKRVSRLSADWQSRLTERRAQEGA